MNTQRPTNMRTPCPGPGDCLRPGSCPLPRARRLLSDGCDSNRRSQGIWSAAASEARRRFGLGRPPEAEAASRFACRRTPYLLVAQWVFLVLTCLPCVFAARGAELNPAIQAWLASQTNFQTWSAEVVQTRALKSLAQPLTASGHVWFQAPDHFRWELGNPARTIAVRAGNEMLVIYPKLKRVEKYLLTGEQIGQWRDALALLEAGFPRSQSELERQYVIKSQQVSEKVGRLVLQPKSSTAREMIPQIGVEFDLNDHSLHSTEMQFKDGSSMRNDFQNPIINPKIEPGLFRPAIPANYEVVEPLRKS
jgi:outer membrane lipoprotein-sorting protein